MSDNPDWWEHDPNDVLDYAVSWATWLGADTIATSTWTVDAGLTKSAESNTTTLAVIWITGGTIGTDYSAVNHIVTAGGRQADKTLKWTVKAR